jgi:signal peptidase I
VLSLLTFAGLILIFTVAMAWLLPRVARGVGSHRAQFRHGLLVVVLLFGLGVFARVIESFFVNYTRTTVQVIGLAAAVLIGQLYLAFIVMKKVFDLPTKRTWAVFGAWLGLIAVQLGLMFGLVRPFVVEAFQMPTASMSPTIEPADRFLACKLLKPRRWDLIAYWNNDPHGRARYVKRLVALPGERLRFDGGGVFINDQAVEVPAVLAGKCHAKSPGTSRGTSLMRYRDGETITLGPDEYFFVGDNIDISADSRINGPTKSADIVGVIDLIYWPARKMRIVR